MKRFTVSEMHFSPEDLLDFWQHEHGNLDFSRRREFLELIEVQDLVGIVKPAVLNAMRAINGNPSSFAKIAELSKNFTLNCRMWNLDYHYLVFYFDFNKSDDETTNWEPAPISVRITWLMSIWIQNYGMLSWKHLFAFRENPEVKSIVEYQLQDVIAEVHKNKKVKAVLQNLISSGCIRHSESDNRINEADEVNLKNEALRAEKLLEKVNRSFEVEVEVKKNEMERNYMDLSSSKFAPPATSRNEYVCNSCGAVIGLFNNHMC